MGWSVIWVVSGGAVCGVWDRCDWIGICIEWSVMWGCGTVGGGWVQ